MQLIILLAIKGSTKIDLEKRLGELKVVVDHDLLHESLGQALMAGLLTSDGDIYRPVHSYLVRFLQLLIGATRIKMLPEMVRKHHPLYRGTCAFLYAAGFTTQLPDSLGLLCSSDWTMWQDISPVYVLPIWGHALNLMEFQTLLMMAEKAFGEDIRGRTLLIAIDRSLQAGDLHQIFALRAQHGVTVIPLPYPALIQAQSDHREIDLLKTQTELYMGRTDLYDTTAIVTDALSFFGRQQILASLYKELTSGHSIIVFGIRRIGKSSLLYRLQDECDWPVAIVSIQGHIGGILYVLDEALEKWISAIRRAFPGLQTLSWENAVRAHDRPNQLEFFKSKVLELVRLLERQPRSPGLLLFLDEIDELVN